MISESGTRQVRQQQQQHLVVTEDLGLGKHGIHKGGLAVVDVSNDGDVADHIDGSRDALCTNQWAAHEDNEEREQQDHTAA